MIGKSRLTLKEKRMLAGLVNFACEMCLQKEDQVGKLHPHRIVRGWDNGTYAPKNIHMICTSCHKLVHANEFVKSRSK